MKKKGETWIYCFSSLYILLISFYVKNIKQLFITNSLMNLLIKTILLLFKMEDKFAWILCPKDNWDSAKGMITTSLESGIDHIVVLDPKQNENIRKLGLFKIISPSDDSDIYLVGIGGEGDGTLTLDDKVTVTLLPSSKFCRSSA